MEKSRGRWLGGMAPRKHRRRLTYTCVLHRASKRREKKKEKKWRRKKTRGRGQTRRRRERGGREGRRRRIANGRMGAFETRCKGTTGSRSTLCREIIAPLDSARHGSAAALADDGISGLAGEFSAGGPKLTTVRVTLFSSGNKGRAARESGTSDSYVTYISQLSIYICIVGTCRTLEAFRFLTGYIYYM